MIIPGLNLMESPTHYPYNIWLPYQDNKIMSMSIFNPILGVDVEARGYRSMYSALTF